MTKIRNSYNQLIDVLSLDQFIATRQELDMQHPDVQWLGISDDGPTTSVFMYKDNSYIERIHAGAIDMCMLTIANRQWACPTILIAKLESTLYWQYYIADNCGINIPPVKHLNAGEVATRELTEQLTPIWKEGKHILIEALTRSFTEYIHKLATGTPADFVYTQEIFNAIVEFDNSLTEASVNAIVTNSECIGE